MYADKRFDALAVRLYRQRVPVTHIVAQIHRDHGVKLHSSTIYAALHRAGVATTRRNYSAILRDEKQTRWIVDQWNAGLIAADIQRGYKARYGRDLPAHSLACVLREFDLIAGRSVARNRAADPLPAWKLRAYDRHIRRGVPDQTARFMAHIAHIEPALVAARMAVMSPVL